MNFLTSILPVIITGVGVMIIVHAYNNRQRPRNASRAAQAVSIPNSGQTQPSQNEVLFEHGYVRVLAFDDCFCISFEIESDKAFDIGENMNGINPDAYMNGYGWQSFLTHYLSMTSPDLLKGLEHDPEAGLYSGYYPISKENKQKAISFANVIKDLIENENKVYDFLRQEGHRIDWE